VLESIARATPIAEVLSDLCTGTERLVPHAVVGISILDRAACVFESAVFPSLGESFEAGIRGARVADKPGTCAVAIHNGELVTSEDVADDGRFWNEWRALNLQHGVRAIQSRPFFSPDGIALGTFVVGFREPAPRTAFDKDVFALGAHLAGLALSRYRDDERARMLIGELQHRSRNQFAVIEAIMQLSLQGSASLDDFKNVFRGRLAALVHAQRLATDRSGAEFTALVEAILAPYLRPGVTIDGPPLTLTADAAAAFALSLHELATNAAKYGALTGDDGRLAVTWHVEPGVTALAGRFKLLWQESDGPPVAPPTKSGFGTRTIERNLAHAVDAKVSLDFRPEGFVCSIDAPAERMLTTDPMNWSAAPNGSARRGPDAAA
jgi:two-component sensor histidine kinase